MGSIDKLVRLTIAIALIVLFYAGVIKGTLGILLLILALILTITSLVQFCPLYTIFGIKTCKKN